MNKNELDTASCSAQVYNDDIKALLSNDDNTVVVTTSTDDVISASYGSIVKKDVEDNSTIIIQQPLSSTMGASVNLVNAMMGTGIIGLPLALHLCGFWLGIGFILATAYLTCMTMYITIICGLKTNTLSLVALSQKLIGRTGSYIVNFIIFFHTAGTSVSYYICMYMV